MPVPVQVNPQLDKERAISGVELVTEQFKVIHVAQHGRRTGSGGLVSRGPDGQGVVRGLVPRMSLLVVRGAVMVMPGSTVIR